MADPLILHSFLLGLNAFFSPCGFPMLPAYLAYYLPREADDTRVATSLARGLGGGLLAGAGAVLVIGAIGLLALLLGAPFKEHVLLLELVGGLLVIGLGVLTLLGRGPSFKMRLQPSRRQSAWSLFGFGALYAGVAASCVAPLFLGVLVQALAAGSWLQGAAYVGAYGAGLSGLLVGVTLLVAAGQHRIVHGLKRVLPHVEKVSGVILVLVGLYLVYYWARVEYGLPALLP